MDLADNIEKSRPYITMTGRLLRIPGLDALLGRPVLHWRVYKDTQAVSAVIGWGRKPSALMSAKFANQQGLAFVSLEDGFLRSVGMGSEESPLSVVVDDLGIYYDALMPSRFETLVLQNLTDQQKRRASDLLAAWRQARVSKYNHAREYRKPLPERYVLVADQVAGDVSIHYGMAGQASFERMLTAALQEYSDCTVLLKIHPGVVNGRKQGHFDWQKLALNPRIQVLSEDVHPAALLEHAQAVYCVTSQIGFEGLLWGKRVRTFGMPFYAGWGLTIDDLAAPKRRQPVALVNLVHAALLTYPRYIDPETGQACEAERVLAWMALQRRMRERFPPFVDALGFSVLNSLPNRLIVKKFFQGSKVFFDRKPGAIPEGASLVVCRREIVEKRCPGKQADTVVQLENGIIGVMEPSADMIQSLSWVMDTRGIYYDATRSSDLEHILQHGEFDSELLSRAAALRRRLVSGNPGKKNASREEWRRPMSASSIILVPGQLESDASLTLAAPGIRSDLELLKAVRENHPNAYILYAPHLDKPARLRDAGAGQRILPDYCDEIVTDAAMADLLRHVDEVHTISSLLGFHALLHGKKTVCQGLPFYAGWGLTTDSHRLDRRTRRLSLDELVAGALILYPTYISRTTGKFSTPERVLDELQERRKNVQAGSSKWHGSLRLALTKEKRLDGNSL